MVITYKLGEFIIKFGHSLLLLRWPMVFPKFALTPNRHYIIIIIILPVRITGIVNFICPFHPSYRDPVSLNAPTRPNCKAYICFDTRKAARPCQFDLLSSTVRIPMSYPPFKSAGDRHIIIVMSAMVIEFH